MDTFQSVLLYHAYHPFLGSSIPNFIKKNKSKNFKLQEFPMFLIPAKYFPVSVWFGV